MHTVSTSVLSAFIRSMERRHGKRNIAPLAVMNRLIECLGVAEELYKRLDPREPGEPAKAAGAGEEAGAEAGTTAETVVERKEMKRNDG